MTPKRCITAFALIICMLSSYAQQPLEFSPSEWDFGSIRESDGPVSFTFTGRNTSDRPLVILHIFSSCGCTVPEYTRKPILPQEKTEIRVTYDPANRPGAFSKELGIFDSERNKIGVLHIRGTVEGREKTLAERYPMEVGTLRLTHNLCTFSYLYHGRPSEAFVGIANPTDRSVSLELVPDRNSGFLTTDYPRRLAAGERAEIAFRYDVPENSEYYGTVEDVITLRIDGRNAPIRLTTHGISVDNPDLSNEIYTPKAEIDKYMLKFGVVKRDEGLQKRPFRITNTGLGTLTVRAVETEGGVGCTLRTGRKVEAGKSITAYATLDPVQQKHGLISGRITVITDDPARPMRRLRATAVIEE